MTWIKAHDGNQSNIAPMNTIDTATAPIDATRSEPGAVKRRWWALLLLGILQLIGGAFAISVPVAATLAAALVFGAVLIVLGALQAAHAISVRKSKKVVLLQMLGGLLYLATGALVLWFPVPGAISLTMLVGAMLIADGAIRCMLAYRLRPAQGWGWFLSAGIASAVVGILLLVGWPLTGLSALGLLLGVNLLFVGMTNSALAVAYRARLAHEARPAPRDDLRDLPA